MIMLLVVGLVLIGVGALLGSAWTTQALDGTFRRHAAERRRLNEEWRAVRALRAQLRCTGCSDELDIPRPALVGGDDSDDD